MNPAINRPARILLVVGLLAGIPSLVHSLAHAATTSTAAYTVGVPFAALYILVGFLILRISPAWPGRPLWWLWAALAWGAGTSLLFVTLAGAGLSTLTRQLNMPMFSASLAGALPEEIGKALGVLVIALACRNINRPWHVLCVAVMVGLGFMVVENLGYGANGGLMHPESDAAGVLKSWISRSVAVVGIHSIYTAACGWGIGKALYTPGRSRGWRIAMAILWFLVGFGLHFAWNSSPESPVVNLVKLVVVALLSYGIFLWIYVRSWRMARAERKSLESEGAPSTAG